MTTQHGQQLSSYLVGWWLLLSASLFLWDGTDARTCGGKNRATAPIFNHPDMDIHLPRTDGTLPDVMVGAYYYSWHSNDFHNGEEYLRDYLVPRHQPSMGEYDDTKPGTIAEHLRMSRQANCKVWFTSWFGRYHVTDNTTIGILQHEDLHDHKIAIHYESYNRLRKKYASANVVNSNNQTHYFTLAEVGLDMRHLCANYFGHPNYYRINGRPVIVLYLARTLDDKRPGLVEEAGADQEWGEAEFLTGVVNGMRTEAMTACGDNPYIIGDFAFGTYVPSRDSASISLLDAITFYDVYGQTDHDTVDRNKYGGDNLMAFYARQAVWKAAANDRGKGYIPAVSPGFNDRAVRLRQTLGAEALSLSRRLNGPDDPEGSFFAKALEYAMAMVDERADYLLAVTSFNEIHEDTQIECMTVDPAAAVPVPGTTNVWNGTHLAYHIWNATRNGYLPSSEYTTSPPDDDLTQGLVYEAYYDLYLNIIREMTTVPLFYESFDKELDSSNPALSLLSGTRQALELSKTDASNPPRIRIKLDASKHAYFVVDFSFAGSGTGPGERLVVQCFYPKTTSAGGMTMTGEQSSEMTTWEFGTNYTTHQEYHYAVAECNVTDATGDAMVEIRFEGGTGEVGRVTSVFLDDIRVTGLTAPIPSTLKPTTAPTKTPTKAPTKTPTKTPTRSPTRLPTRRPTPAPTKKKR